MLATKGLGYALGLLAFSHVFRLIRLGRVMCQAAVMSQIEPVVQGGERHRGV